MPAREKFNKIILILGDVAILYISLLLALTIRYGGLPTPKIWNAHLIPFAIIFFIWIVIFYIAGLYDPAKFISAKEMQKQIIWAMEFAGIIALAAFYLIPYFLITPKTNLFLDLIITLLLLIIWRRNFLMWLIKARKINILFFGLSKDIAQFISHIAKNPQLGYHIAAIMKLPEENGGTYDIPSEIPAFNFDHNLTDLIKNKGVSLIVASSSIKQNQEIIRMFYEILPLRVSIVDFPRFYEELFGKVPVSLITESWFLENLMELNKGAFETIKRWSDIILAIVLGTATIIITPLIALLIKIDSRGPVFYSQKRIGKDGKIFEIIKFRSMVQNAEQGEAKWAMEKDGRVTKFGGILRKTRIDELPQLWNVLKGELSFVGPRPERPEFVEMLKKEIPHYAMRHIVKPGLSGWAQINFPYGASVEDSMEKLQYDLYYIKNRSLPLEFSIYLKTIATVIRRQGR
ncbi:MAG: sugar transferase [Candidatus Niyogibacteria bacterium]|nr:sugar transferase [Candidatus Niyogibacteria bacterium]